MGELVQAAKITHVPSIWMSENFEKFHGIRDNAINGLRELGRRARDARVDTFVVIDAHWIVNQGFHLNAKPVHKGEFTSHELPHFLNDLTYEYRGDPELGNLIVDEVKKDGFRAIAHDTRLLAVEYGTLIPMRHMNGDGFARVVPVAANQFASIEEGRRWGESIARAISMSGRRVSLLASGSMSHAFWPNAVSADGLDSVNGEFNRQVDLRVLQLWQEGRWREFLDMLPDYAVKCHGEVNMIDSAILFGALGWKDYAGRGEIIGEYYGSSGTGQVNVDFSLMARAA